MCHTSLCFRRSLFLCTFSCENMSLWLESLNHPTFLHGHTHTHLLTHKFYSCTCTHTSLSLSLPLSLPLPLPLPLSYMSTQMSRPNGQLLLASITKVEVNNAPKGADFPFEVHFKGKPMQGHSGSPWILNASSNVSILCVV
jgi:hypothetical protein